MASNKILEMHLDDLGRIKIYTLNLLFTLLQDSRTGNPADL